MTYSAYKHDKNKSDFKGAEIKIPDEYCNDILSIENFLLCHSQITGLKRIKYIIYYGEKMIKSFSYWRVG